MTRGGLWHALVLVGALALTGGRAHADDNPSQLQKAAVFAKGSVVRVLGYWEVTYTIGDSEIKEYVGGTGSGFFASADGFVVTNAHVVEDIQNGEEKAKEDAFSQLVKELQEKYADVLAKMSNDEKDTLVRNLLASAKAVPVAQIVLPEGSKFDYVIKGYGSPGTGTDVAIIKCELKDVPNLPVADSDAVEVQDRILAIGYPGAADMEGMLDDKSQLEATINEGAVSAIKKTATGEPIIQISASITHGNSGGPTINQNGEVIGLSTFGSKGEVQGFNFIVASNTVKKFLAEAKVDTTPSATIKSWRKGLDEYYDFYLDDAITDFEDVLVKFPTHSEVARVERLARAAKKDGKGKTKPAPAPAPELASSPGSGAGPKAGGAKAAASTASTSVGGDGSSSAGTGIAVGLVLLGLTIGGVFLLKSRKKGPGAQAAPGMHPPFAGPPGTHPNFRPPGHAPGHGAVPHPTPFPMGGQPQMPPPGGVNPMHVGPIKAVAKTMMVGGSGSHAPVAATAFGSLSLGQLTCTRGLLHGQRFALTAQGILIGRQPGLAQIVIDDPRSSGKHVWIGYEQGQLVAIDQGTTNGTFVNDVRNGRISKAPLKDGDVVIVSEPDCLSLQIKLG